ncbi:hypothetical protein OQA88_11997 [Cercophora sp. LCS_1]
MSVDYLAKRRRKLLDRLWIWQGYDHPLPAHIFLSVGYLLRFNSRLKVVDVKIKPGQDPGYKVEHSTEISTTWLLKFILESLYFTSPENPTLFRWYSPARHRHYNIFAYISEPMERQAYSISELLALRGEPGPNGGPNLDVNPEIASDVIRKSGSESSEAKGEPKRDPKQESKQDHKYMGARVKDDSSVSSEEVLFKGNMSRRSRQPIRDSTEEPPREPSHQATCEPFSEPAHEPIHEPIRAAVREATRDLNQDGIHDHSRNEEWKYRGRSESEVATGEPFSAPTGISAQRSEGFQRFYKAVVSPTHVRVTAGGRIVPNTRGPPSPTSKRSKDEVTTEGHGGADKMPHVKPFPHPMGMVPPIPVMPQFIPGYPPGFQHIQGPMSFVPMAFGAPMPPGFPFPQPSASSVNATQSTDGSTLKETHNTKHGEVRSETGAAQEKQDKVKLAPPELFDYTKPFFFNGQYMYPVPAAFPAGMGAPMMPYPILGVPPGVPSPMAGPPPPAPPPGGPMHTMPAPSFPAPRQVPTMETAHHPVLPTHLQPPSGPPISSIRPSDITKKQIATFKQSLKYHEDQLQFNRHQIDEKEMEHKCMTLRNHIARFEATYKSQLEFEESVARGSQQKPESRRATPAPVEVKHPSQPTTAEKPLSINGSNVHGSQTATDKTNHGSVRMTMNRGMPDFQVNQAEGGARQLSGYYGESDGQPLPDYQKKGIPIDAALAPVFKPRGGYASSWGGSQNSRDANDDIDRRLLVSTSSYADSSASLGKSTRPKTKRDGLGVPYLLGTLPKGMNPRTARDQDYVYSRPLTDEERRARFLYWGDAPKSVTSGLPKYDGKHFYPPTPVKGQGGTRDLANQCVGTTGRSEVDHEVRETRSEPDPFQSITPVQRPGPSKPSIFNENGYIATRRINPYDPQIFGASEDLPRASEDSDSQGGVPVRTREASADALSYGAYDRRGEKSGGAKLWPAMLKKGSTSSAVSSTTAQGFLPQYSGHAAASLSPTVNRNPISPIGEVSPSKNLADRNDGGALLVPAPEKRGENLPPSNVGSLEDQFKNMNISVDSSDRLDLSRPFHL